MNKNLNNLNNNYIIRRGLAYLIDIVIVLVLSSLISQINFINPNKEQYLEASEKYTELYKNVQNSQEFAKSDEYKELTYQLAKYGYIYTYIDAVVLIGYFVLFQKATKGQTIGKRLLKIRIVDKDNKDVSFCQLLLRGIIIYGILCDILCATGVILFDQSTYYYLNIVVTMFFRILFYASIILAFFKPNAMGLHDIIAKTKVIDLKENINGVIKEPDKDKKGI